MNRKTWHLLSFINVEGKSAPACRPTHLGVATTSARDQVTCKLCLKSMGYRRGASTSVSASAATEPLYHVLLGRVNAEYKRLKAVKYPHRAPETLPHGVESDQVKALLKVVSDQLEIVWRMMS